ncbi:hypothetical protein [uncultured Desulfuromusa sp.]|uniref:hypothetical protein n=1 Tax=uncultured Desulfuromusa sp. TaxID=219183 RepID=UPI002AA5EE3D|nr:hypothetical protein [uncultured Desulfuromusa sp.]
MSLELAKNNTEPYDFYSDGDGSDPISVAVTLDGSGVPATIAVEVETDIFLVAENDTGTIGSYSDIGLALESEEAGIDWELSSDGVTWVESLSPADMDVSATDQTLQFYARAVFTNDGSVATANYSAPNIVITATENP